MILHRRTFVHGLVSLPAGALLADRRPPAGGAKARDGAGLRAALRAARPGEAVVLEPGDYGDVGLFELTAPDVTIRARVPLRSVLRAPLLVTGERARLLGLAFLGDGDDNLYLSAAAACRDSLSIAAPDVEVADCDFGFFPAGAILVRPKGGLRPYIHGCTFHDNRDGGGNHNAHEAISLGYDNPTSNTSMRARVVDNELRNLNVEGEAISVKTSDNLVQGNRLSSSKGGISNRYGERNEYRDNTSTNSRGFVVGDRGSRLVGNTVNGSGSIKVLGGNATADSTKNGPHTQATDTYLEGNRGSLVIGYNYAGQKLPAVNTTVRSHDGSVKLQNHTGTRLPGSA
jgi:hypothetical protein